MEEQLNQLLKAINHFAAAYKKAGSAQYKAQMQQYAKIKQIIEQHLAKTGANKAEDDRLQLKQMTADFLEAIKAAKATNPGLKIT
mgnify:CR=1 FL=1